MQPDRRSLHRSSLAAAACCLILWAGCGAEVDRPPQQEAGGQGGGSADRGSGASTSSAVTSAATATGGAAAGGAASDCIPGDVERECWDCVDNDGDGWIDAWDTECISGFDRWEDRYGPGVPADDGLYCNYDCAFDDDWGSGNDGCDGKAKCDPESPIWRCPYEPDWPYCEPLAQKCLEVCGGALVPNGCDCLGCCDVILSDGTSARLFVPLPTCSEATLDDRHACATCTQNPDCLNPCDSCEYCLGKKELPAECNGVADPCPGGEQACAPDVPCPAGYYCQTGCCVVPKHYP